MTRDTRIETGVIAATLIMFCLGFFPTLVADYVTQVMSQSMPGQKLLLVEPSYVLDYRLVQW